MSQVTVKCLTTTSVDREKRQSILENLVDLGPKILTISLDKTKEIVRESANAIAASLPKIEFPRSLSACDIPEQDCPPYCVCEVVWEGIEGQTLLTLITVTNRAATTLPFTFTSTSFHGATNTPASKIILTPPAALLEPNKPITVKASFDVTNEFQPGQTYTAEVLIKGSYEQCVRISCEAQGPQVAHCNVEQGYPPTRIRAHRWHDHFQCEEPCVETGRVDNPALGPVKGA